MMEPTMYTDFFQAAARIDKMCTENSSVFDTNEHLDKEQEQFVKDVGLMAGFLVYSNNIIQLISLMHKTYAMGMAAERKRAQEEAGKRLLENINAK